MKLKGVGFFEQHIEKLVLGAVSVVFLAVVAMQFLHEPNTIKVGSGQPVAPGQAFEPVLRRAVDIQAKLNTSAEDLGLPEVPSIDLVDDFNRRRTSPVAPSPRIASFGKGSDVQGIVDTKIVGPAGQRLTALDLPAPTTPVAAAYRNTIDPTEPHFNADLAKLLPPAQPYDKASVSVEASFDGTALRAALLSSGDGAAYPAGWWRDLMEIVGISLERQELQSNGEWSTAKPIPAPPGKGVSDLLQNVRAAADIPDLVLEVRSASDSILRPTYYRVIAGPAWKPPSEAVKGGEVGRTTEIRRLAELHQRLMRDQDNIKRRLEAAGVPTTRTPTSGGGGGGGGKGGGGGGGGGGQSPSGDPDREQREREARQRPIREQLKRNEEQVAKVEADLKVMGVDPEGNPLPQEPAAVALTAVKPLLEDSAVRVWAHDLTAEGGKTYRYRVSLQLINPAFGRGASMVADQQDLAKNPVVTTKPSEWSSPVYVLDDRYFHFSSATEADIQGPARARAELYQFFYGYYRPVTVYLEAGDVLTGSVKLPDPAKLPIYDMKALAAADPAQPAQPDPARAPALPGRLQPNQPGRGLNINEGGGDGGGRQAAQPQPEQGQVELPANAKPWEGPVRVAFETFLLDVARIPGGGAAGKSQVFLRGQDGTIAIRGTVEDEKSEIQRLIAASAKDGESQGQPVIPVAPPQRETTPRPDRSIPPPPGGGGGGGGGG